MSPFDRANVTVASRIMLPSYVAFFATIGLNYVLTPPERLTASPSLAYADSVLPLPAWGAVFLTAAALMLLALLTRRRDMYRYALLVCVVSMSVWTVVGVFAVFGSQSSPAGWAWPLLVVSACVATYRSLSAGEV